MNSSLGKMLLDSPIPLCQNLKLYLPTVRDVVSMGEEEYSLLLRIWTIPRSDIIIRENEESKSLNDLQIWIRYLYSSDELREALYESCLVFFHKKIEFFPLSDTIYIGEADTGVLLDLDLYSALKTVFARLISQGSEEEEQYKKTKNMSERERRMYERMKAGEAKLNKIKNADSDSNDQLGKQIVSLVAIGHYTFKEVYDMTMIQFGLLLKKYLDIERYELHTILSPYISSKDNNQENKHWVC